MTTDARSAEMTKLVENAYRDVNIAFANELSMISDRMGLDVWEVIRLANRHPRVNILSPGPGVGGHCIAVDPWFLVHADPANTPLIRTARETNDARPASVLRETSAVAPDGLPVISYFDVTNLFLKVARPAVGRSNSALLPSPREPTIA